MTTKLTNKKLFLITFLLIPSFFALLVTVYYSEITTSQVGEIFNSIARENYDLARNEFGERNVALITGEEKIIPSDPKYYFCTETVQHRFRCRIKTPSQHIAVHINLDLIDLIEILIMFILINLN